MVQLGIAFILRLLSRLKLSRLKNERFKIICCLKLLMQSQYFFPFTGVTIILSYTIVPSRKSFALLAIKKVLSFNDHVVRTFFSPW